VHVIRASVTWAVLPPAIPSGTVRRKDSLSGRRRYALRPSRDLLLTEPIP
jgi:hypothetical protein